MANLPALHQSDGDSPEITRAITHQEMKPYVKKTEKRKFFARETDESSLHPSKHQCYKAAITSEDKSFLTNSRNEKNAFCDMDLMDSRVDSGQDSNSFPWKSVKSCMNLDSYDDIGASTSCSNLAKGKFGNRSFYSESGFEEDTRFTNREKHPRLDFEWDDDDYLKECDSGDYCSEKDQRKTEDLEEFLSCSGMTPNLYVHSAERWSLDQEAQLGRQKATIDKEFEHYFSTLML